MNGPYRKGHGKGRGYAKKRSNASELKARFGSKPKRKTGAPRKRAKRQRGGSRR